MANRPSKGLAADYDSNMTSSLPPPTSDFASFGVWQDANSNGVTDAGEFQRSTAPGSPASAWFPMARATSAANGQVTVHGTRPTPPNRGHRRCRRRQLRNREARAAARAAGADRPLPQRPGLMAMVAAAADNRAGGPKRWQRHCNLCERRRRNGQYRAMPVRRVCARPAAVRTDLATPAADRGRSAGIAPAGDTARYRPALDAVTEHVLDHGGIDDGGANG